MEEALYLSNIADEVVLVHRRDELRAEKILQSRILDRAENGNVTIMWDHTLEEVLGDDTGVTGMRVTNVKSGESTDVDLMLKDERDELFAKMALYNEKKAFPVAFIGDKAIIGYQKDLIMSELGLSYESR